MAKTGINIPRERRMWMKTILAFFTVMVLTACGSQAVKDEAQSPAWLNGESSQYPRKQYLFGVGEADSMTSAKTRARAEIAKIFTVDIQVNASESSQYENLNLGQDAVATETLSVSQSIETHSQQRLQGIELPEVWQDKTTQRYYALAVLPRLKTASSLRNDINSLDQATESVLASARGSSSLFQKVRLSSDAISLQSQRRQLVDQLTVVALTGNDVPAKWPLQKLIADRNDLLSRITVHPQAEGLESEKMQVALGNALANDGITVSEQGDYTMALSLKATELDPRGAWYYSKASLVVTIYDKNNTNLGGKTWDYKVSATDPSLTKVRVLEGASAILDKELTKAFFSMVE